MLLPIWGYWEGNMPPIIQLCIESIRKQNPSFRLITPNELRCSQGGQDLLDYTSGMPPCIRSDLLRYWLLHRIGGLWVDCDCICIYPLPLAEVTAQYDLVTVRQLKRESRMLGYILGGRKSSTPLAIAERNCRWYIERMKKRQSLPYSITSVSLISNLWRNQHTNYPMVVYDANEYGPVPWYNVRTYMIEATDAEHAKSSYFPPHAKLYHLTNKAVGWLKGLTREEILRGNRFVSFLLRKGLEV